MPPQRKSMDIGDDFEAQYRVNRRRQLKEQRDALQKEMDELSEKQGVRMEEMGVTEMKWQGKQVARIEDYPTQSIKGDFAKAMRVEEPEIWQRYASHGHVRKVVCS